MCLYVCACTCHGIEHVHCDPEQDCEFVVAIGSLLPVRPTEMGALPALIYLHLRFMCACAMTCAAIYCSSQAPRTATTCSLCAATPTQQPTRSAAAWRCAVCWLLLLLWFRCCWVEAVGGLDRVAWDRERPTEHSKTNGSAFNMHVRALMLAALQFGLAALTKRSAEPFYCCTAADSGAVPPGRVCEPVPAWLTGDAPARLRCVTNQHINKSTNQLSAPACTLPLACLRMFVMLRPLSAAVTPAGCGTLSSGHLWCLVS